MSDQTTRAEAAYRAARQRHQAAVAALTEAQAAVDGVPDRRAALRQRVATTTGNARLNLMADLIALDEGGPALAARVAEAQAAAERAGHEAALAEHAYLGSLDGDQEAEARALRDRHKAEMDALTARQAAERQGLSERRTPVNRRLLDLFEAHRAAIVALGEEGAAA